MSRNGVDLRSTGPLPLRRRDAVVDVAGGSFEDRERNGLILFGTGSGPVQQGSLHAS